MENQILFYKEKKARTWLSRIRNITFNFYRTEHRVGRVLSFFSSRRNWDSLNHSPRSPVGEYAPTPFGNGGRGPGSLAGERGGWDSPNSDEGTYTLVLCIVYIYVLCGTLD